MNTQIGQQRFVILKNLARYEEAYKNIIKLAAAANAENEIVQINNPLYAAAKFYKEKINKLRNELKELK